MKNIAVIIDRHYHPPADPKKIVYAFQAAQLACVFERRREIERIEALTLEQFLKLRLTDWIIES